jgi:hypothetical protein
MLPGQWWASSACTVLQRALGHVERPRVALHEVLGEAGDLLAPVAQRRNQDVDDVQPIEEVLAKAAGRDFAPEVAVGGADRSHVDPDVVVAADPGELTILQDMQELGLQGGMQLADLVEEDGAAVGQLEAARLALVGAGKGATLVAEQLALEQLARHRRAVDLDEGRSSARGVDVDGASGQLLADTRLTADQHRDIGARRLLDHLLDVTHLGTDQQCQLPPQALAVVLASGRRRRLAAGTSRHGPDGALEILGRVRPANEVVGTGLNGLDDLSTVTGIGDHDDGTRLGQLGGPADEIDARHAG